MNRTWEDQKQDMEAFEVFERALREALAHLYDPLYHPPESLRAALDVPPGAEPEAFQAALIGAVEGLRPAPTVPATARSRRLYDLLVCRFIQNLTQEETADRLGITPRHLRREQPEAVHVLAARLWEGWTAGARRPATAPPSAPAPATAPEWLSQIRQELLALQRSAPGATADLGVVLPRAMELAATIMADSGVRVQMEPVASNLVVAVHPTALQQILLAAIRQLTEAGTPQEITLSAVRGPDTVRVLVQAEGTALGHLTEVPFIREVLALQGGSAEVESTPDTVSLVLTLPAADRLVLVVDDNPDLVHVFSRYLVGTRYRILHLARGQEVFATVEAAAPQVIVLDVMLPDVDGWELLAKLHQHPATRSIPVVVCSVVREESLAMALGAAAYLLKPVERTQFLTALEQAFNRSAPAGPTSPASSAAVC